jgi:hypothetical protein
MAQREMEREMVAVRLESQKAQEAVKEERAGWVEDEVEELERWDGLE